MHVPESEGKVADGCSLCFDILYSTVLANLEWMSGTHRALKPAYQFQMTNASFQIPGPAFIYQLNGCPWSSVPRHSVAKKQLFCNPPPQSCMKEKSKWSEIFICCIYYPPWDLSLSFVSNWLCSIPNTSQISAHTNRWNVKIKKVVKLLFLMLSYKFLVQAKKTAKRASYEDFPSLPSIQIFPLLPPNKRKTPSSYKRAISFKNTTFFSSHKERLESDTWVGR